MGRGLSQCGDNPIILGPRLSARQGRRGLIATRTYQLHCPPQGRGGSRRGTQSEDDVEYRVELEVYNGPLDLLLYLIKRDELDIYDIPITRILDSYMRYVEVLRDLREEAGLDINVAGDFLVMAATLMEIKSAMLLPRQPEQVKAGQSSAAQDL